MRQLLQVVQVRQVLRWLLVQRLYSCLDLHWQHRLLLLIDHTSLFMPCPLLFLASQLVWLSSFDSFHSFPLLVDGFLQSVLHRGDLLRLLRGL